MKTLAIRNLKKTYLVNNAPYAVFSQLNCTIDMDKITVVLGKSGCGKTTLLRLISGLEKPDGGEILKPENTKIGMMFQEARLMPWLTCEKNISFGLPPYYSKAKIAKLIDTVGLTEFAHSYPCELSGGMQQRTSLARTLAYDTDLILMDEPFAALDYFTRETMQQEVLKMRALSHKGIIFVTHNIDEALLLADRILILQGGTITKDMVLSPDANRNLLSPPYIALKQQILTALKINKLIKESKNV